MVSEDDSGKAKCKPFDLRGRAGTAHMKSVQRQIIAGTFSVSVCLFHVLVK